LHIVIFTGEMPGAYLISEHETVREANENEEISVRERLKGAKGVVWSIDSSQRTGLAGSA
jgi:hypothetical protein